MDGQAFSGHFQPMIGLPVLRRSRGHQHRASAAHTQMRHSVKSRPVSCHPDQCCGMSLTLFRARNGASDSRLVRVAADSAVKAPCAGSTAAGMPRSSQTGRQARAARDMRAAAGTRPCGRLLLSMQGTQTSGQRGAGGWRTDTSARSIASTTASGTHSAWEMAIRVLRLSAYLGCEPCDSCESSSASPPDNPKQS